MISVVLLSGGIDSTTCLAGAVSLHGAENVIALTIFYGQKHERELQSARDIAAHYKVQHMVEDLSAVFKLSDAPLLKDSENEVPEGDYLEQMREANGMVKTYVPFRNGLFLSYATAIAYSIGASEVVYGAHADDAAGNAYPDCTEDFYMAMRMAIHVGTGEKVVLVAPLQKMNKAQVVETGTAIGAPYHLSWSCYNGGEVACGKCGTCVDRLKAFDANGLIDTIPYAEIANG